MKFYIYRDDKGEYRWRLRARNGKIIADSGESYRRKSACLRSIGLVQSTTTVTPFVFVEESKRR